MKAGRKGQISLEYLIVVGFVVFVVILLIGFSLFYTAGARDRIRVNQLENFANKLVTSAEAVYFAGEPSRVTITAYLPEGIESFRVEDNSFVFSIITDAGTSTIAYPSSVPLGSVSFLLNDGVKKLRIEAGVGSVSISEVP